MKSIQGNANTVSRTLARRSYVRAVLFLFTAVAAIVFPSAQAARAGLLDKLTWKAEKHIGRASVNEMRDSIGFVDDPLLQDYVSDMGNRLAAVSHRTDIPYEFYILDTNQVNAFAAPGGFVFVTRGMMEEVDNDDELAAVMAHEVGHVAAKHGTKAVKKMPFLIAGSILLDRKTDSAMGRVIGTAYSLMQLHHTREDEYQADNLSSQYSFAAGYDPAAMVSFFRKIERKHPTGSLTNIQVSFQTHPKTPNRIAAFKRTDQMAATPANLLKIGRSYYDRYYYHEAIQEFEKTLDVAPDNAEAAAWIGSAQTQLGDFDAAREWFEIALEIEPGHEMALDGLDALDAKETGGLESFARADPAPEREVEDVVAWLDNAIPEIESTIGAGDAVAAGIIECTDGVELAFQKNYRDYSIIARSIRSSDSYRGEVMGNAARLFNNTFTMLSELRTNGGRLSALSKEAARRARETAYYVENTTQLTDEALWAAEDLAAVGEGIASEAPRVTALLNEASDGTRDGYVRAHRGMDALGGSFEIENQYALLLVSNEINDTLLGGFDLMDEAFEKTKEAGEILENQRLRLKRAVLNFNAAVTSPAEEAIYRKMIARRFGIEPDLASELAAKGFGYADMILLLSRARRERTSPEALLRDYDSETTYLDDFLITDAQKTGVESLLLRLASNDLRQLTQKRQLVDLEPEPDPLAAEIFNDYVGNADDALSEAADAIDEGDPQAAAALIEERGRSQSATALSHLLLGLAQRQIGDDYNAALDNFKHASDKDGSNYYARLLMAKTFTDLERYEDANNEYEAALKIAPENAVVLASKAYSMAVSGDLEGAARLYERIVLDLDYSHAGIYLNAGLLYYQEGYMADALDAFHECIRLDPERPRLVKMIEILEAT